MGRVMASISRVCHRYLNQDTSSLMRNADLWKPSKYVYRRSKLIASRNPKDVGVASRLIGDRIASIYQRYLPRFCRGRLLDLGCGRAPLYALYKMYAEQIVCADWPQSLHGSEFLDVHCDLSQPLPFADGAFDMVLLSDVLEHIPTPERLLGEISRVLTAHGHLIMNVPFLYWIHEAPHDYYRFTEFALRRLLEGADLRISVLDRMGGRGDVIADLMAKGLIRIPYLGRPLAVIAQSLADIPNLRNSFRKVTPSFSDLFPIGYFLVAEKGVHK